MAKLPFLLNFLAVFSYACKNFRKKKNKPPRVPPTSVFLIYRVAKRNFKTKFTIPKISRKNKF